METQYGWLLNLICYLPAVGAALIVVFVDTRDAATIKRVAAVVTAADFMLALPLWFLYRTDGSQFQFVTRRDWIPSMGVEYHVGADGFAVLLILLATLLGFIAVLGSHAAVTFRVKEYFAGLLLLQTGAIGVFCSLDLMLFYIFFELTLVPSFFLIAVWGGARRLSAAIKFFLYHMVGSVVMLMGILALYFVNADGLTGVGLIGLGHDPSFSIPHFAAVADQVPPTTQLWIFLAFFAGLAVRVPVFPFHTWLSDAHVEAPTAATVFLSGVALKIGIFGLVRLSLPLLPDAAVGAAAWVGGLAIVGIVYGALVAMAQKDMKALITTLTISYMGFVVLGLFTFTNEGMGGAMLQTLNHGVSFGALFLMVGVAEKRRRTRMIAEFGGLGGPMPLYSLSFLVIALSAMGLPALNGFIGQFLILIGAFTHGWVWAVFAAVGVVLVAACLMWLYQRLFFGDAAKESSDDLPDLDLRERLTIAPLIVLVVWIGLFPQPFLDRLQPTVDRVMEQVSVAFPDGGVVPDGTEESSGNAPEEAPAEVGD